jgi:hypothetical protein
VKKPLPVLVAVPYINSAIFILLVLVLYSLSQANAIS